MCTLLVTETVAYLISEGKLAWLLLCTLLMSCLISAGELAWFLMCTHPVTQAGLFFVLVGELAWFSMCTLLVMQVAYLVSESELVWFLMCTLLVTLLVMQTVACLVSECELAQVFIVLSCGNKDFGAASLRGELLCFWP